jgi:hypothetical protein
MSFMQPSKERESEETDPLEDLNGLPDDDLAGEVANKVGQSGSGVTKRPRVGVDGRWLSLKLLGVTVAAVATGVVAGGFVPLVDGTLGAAAGILLGTFLVGLTSGGRRYVETGLTGALAGAGTAVSNVLGIGFLPIGLDYLSQWGLPLLVVSGALGLVLGLLGHYFGNDLRTGVTGDLPG